MSTFHYFAYGSNMLTERLVARCPSARPIGVAQVSDHELFFHKRSVDGSGKAGLLKAARGAPATSVYGVMFDISVTDHVALDRAEGHGYTRHDNLSVTPLGTTQSMCVTSYVALEDAMNPGLAPYDWYMALMIAGARQHGLPTDYIARLDGVATLPDPDARRRTRLEARAILEVAGCPLTP